MLGGSVVGGVVGGVMTSSAGPDVSKRASGGITARLGEGHGFGGDGPSPHHQHPASGNGSPEPSTPSELAG